jgi:hypothetical protein
MNEPIFDIELRKIHWLDNIDDPDDRCAHGKVRVTIGGEIVANNSADPNDWWTLSAMALHLLRTLESDHTLTNPIADCLIPGEGHHIDHLENDPIVHIETAYPIVAGRNWWVTHDNKVVNLKTETGNQTQIPFDKYKQQVLSFVDKVEDFYNISKPKNLPEQKYDRDAYIKFWSEWEDRRSKWN